MTFRGGNGGIRCNTLIVNRLSKYTKFSKKLRPARFFENFEKFYISLIINHLSLNKNFYLFVFVQKSLQVLNFHFRRKYHFVKLKKSIFVAF